MHNFSNKIADSKRIGKAISLEDRIVRVMQPLGIEQAHFAARTPSDWEGLANYYPEVISSLTVFCPAFLNATPLQNVSSRLMIVFADRG